MSKRLIIAEKPSVGRDIANVLNCRENGNGCRVGENDIVTWAVGHLVGLCYPDEMDEKYKEWRLEDLPIFPTPFKLKVLESSAKQYEIVKSLMNDPDVDSIVCATDAGREGELIFRYIYQMVGCTKPVERLWISSLTYRAIKEGFENLKPDSEYDNLYESARCRSEADWLIGMNGSRAYSIENEMKRLSIGRVVSPTLSILVKRELERRNFVAEEYCEVVAAFDGYEGRMVNPEMGDRAPKSGSGYGAADAWSHFPIAQKQTLEQLVKSHSGSGEVILYEAEEETQPPQLLYDLTSLQRDANRLFGMSSKRTLDTAQSLYERHKAITYPRTDSRFLTADIRSTLPKRLESFLSGELGTFASQAMKSERDLFGRFINNKGVSDHHAIIPTGEAKGLEKWTKSEKQIYDLISRRFIGMFFEDRDVLHQKIETSLDGNVFRSGGEKVLKEGWSAVDTSRRNRVQELPELKEGDMVKVSGIRLRTDATKPPAPHTEASLLNAMEHAGKIVPEDSPDERESEFGIGTPATRAATIEKIIEKEMAVRKGKALIPTEYGIKLISILPEVLQSPEMTGEWEAKLSRISKGTESPDEFMAGIRSLTVDVINYAAAQGDTGISKTTSVGACPLCGSPVREYPNAYYCTNRNCEFRPVYKAVKGSHPTIQSITMRELLANGTATDEKGTYSLIPVKPFIAFQHAPKPVPDYKKLHALIEDYGIKPVDKVANGGGLWLPGGRHDEFMKDFVRECKEIGCEFGFVQDSKALKHKSGWCHRVDPEDLEKYRAAFGRKAIVPASEKDKKASLRTPVIDTKSKKTETSPRLNIDDPVLKLIQESGFEYTDKRANGGSLWIIAGKTEGKELCDQCAKLGVTFAYSDKGGRASKHRPAWYSVKSH